MKAVIHTGEPLAWATPLGLPWPLLPVGNRPWIEYWIEWCVGRGIRDLQVVLGDAAYEIEHYLGDGQRWGIGIDYSFLKDSSDPDAFLRRDPLRWRGGIFYLRRPCFPRRRKPAPSPDEGAETRPDSDAVARDDQGLLCFHSPTGAALENLLLSRKGATRRFPAHDIAPQAMRSLQDYYELNMALVRGEIRHYLSPGYAKQDEAYLGFNVAYPPSAELTPPLIIGNDCRIHARARLGPDVVMGNRTIVDRQARVARSVVLDGTYLGAGIEVEDRIVAGHKLIDPQDDTVLELRDMHLLSPIRPSGSVSEPFRNLIHRLLALVFCLLLAVPWSLGVLGGFLLGSRYRHERFVGRKGQFRSPVWRTRRQQAGLLHKLGLDVYPQLIHVLSGQLWLCGQLPCHAREAAEVLSWPSYLPGVFSLADQRHDRDDLLLRRLDARIYAHRCSLREDLKLLVRALVGRATGQTMISGTP